MPMYFIESELQSNVIKITCNVFSFPFKVGSFFHVFLNEKYD